MKTTSFIRNEFYRAFSIQRLIKKHGVRKNSRGEMLIIDPRSKVMKVFRFGGLPPSILVNLAAKGCVG